MMTEDKRKELVIRVRRAFKKVPYPGNKIGDKEELADFVGKRWDEVKFDDINHNSGLILFFNSSAFAYYLQAYMIAILEYPDKVKNIVKEDLIYHLGNNEHTSPQLLQKLFNQEQGELIYDFLLNLQFEDVYPLSNSNNLNPGLLRLREKDKAEFDINWTRAVNYWK
jgi:hypothetical protein